MSASLTGGHQTAESNRKRAIASTGRKHTEAALKKMSLIKIGKVPTDESKRKNSESRKKSWKDPDYIKRQMKARQVAQNKKEKRLGKILDDLYPGEWKFVGDGEVIISGKNPDFINCNGQKKIIELFGNYWHRDQNPQDRIDIFKPFGYETLVVWEWELNSFKSLRRKIFNFAELRSH